MNSKERFEFNKKNNPYFFNSTYEDVVKDLVNQLINALYIPLKGYDNLIKFDPIRLYHFGIKDYEPINWGDLKCNEVSKFEDGTFLVTIDEAAPNSCVSFCEYIEKYMKSYGWECKVITEW